MKNSIPLRLNVYVIRILLRILVGIVKPVHKGTYHAQTILPLTTVKAYKDNPKNKIVYV